MDKSGYITLYENFMKKIGIDFGTTNSVISYCENEKVFTFEYGGAGGSRYIPSFVSYELGDPDEISVGKTAREQQTQRNFEVFSRFKLFLAIQDEEVLQNEGFTKQPADITKDYLTNLIEDYRRQQLGNATLEKVVITVPDVWVREQEKHVAREKLKEICGEIGFDVQFVSEPISASAYFCHNYKNTEGTRFVGHLLVCDYGGGTLDISLAKSESNNRLVVIDSTGKGYDSQTRGVAGVAFDEHVVWRALNERLSRSDSRFQNLLKEFELLKISQQVRIERKLKKYLEEEELGEVFDDPELFCLETNTIKITVSMFIEVFREKIQPTLEKEVRKILEIAAKKEIDTEDRENFRVILAGGFSSFFLVRKTLRDLLKVSVESDPRFDTKMSLEDTALAISKGAALIANGLVQIIPTCPLSIGIQVLIDEKASDGPPIRRKKNEWLLRKGIQQSEYTKPRFSETYKKLLGGYNQTVKLLINDGTDIIILELNLSFKNVFPNTDLRENEWKIGFSLGSNLIYEMHAEDKIKGERLVTPLGKLLSLGFIEVQK